MNILVTAAEITPFAKAGGLADVVASLSKEWALLGHKVVVVVPKYGMIDHSLYSITPTNTIVEVPMSHWKVYARLWKGKIPNSEVDVYFLESNDYFDRRGIYGDREGYTDNDKRFTFLSRAVFEVAKAINFKPDILHAHDYHTALSLAFLKIFYRYNSLFSKTAGVYTIHNMGYQGQYNPSTIMPLMGISLKDFYPGSWYEHDGIFNSMKVGIMFADKVTAVSPTYSKEIRWTTLGEGMQPYLNSKGGDVIGILNGTDYTEWNPEIDNLIYSPYSQNVLETKEINKQRFLNEHCPQNSDFSNDIPLIGMVTRLTRQKGIDVLEQVLESYLHSGVFRFALLGSGEKRFEDYFRYLERKYSGSVIIHLGYNNVLSHKVIASADYLMMPSLYEPCGLTQMYAMKYGTIPIVRSTGGLSDTVLEYNRNTSQGTGFLFYGYNAHDLSLTINRALSVYKTKPHWNTIRRNGMNADFSAGRSAEEYIKAFKWALEKT